MFQDSQEIIKKFTIGEDDSKKDYLLRENSNFVYSLPLLRHNVDNHEEEEYLMENIFTPEIKKLYDEGVVYIHDKKLAPYCNSLSCLTVATVGVPTTAKNMLDSKPTKKLNTFFRQLSNAVVLLSQQTSGAVMLSQMTTILAGYVYYNEKENGVKTSYEDIREMFYNLIWELNLPLRSGCVDTETELLTPNGFKKYNELSKGDDIYTWDKGSLNIQPINKMNIFNHKGEMHEYKGRDYTQFVTPNHRVVKQVNNSKEFEIKYSEDIFDEKTPPTLPIAMLENNIGGIEISNEFLELITFILTDGSISDKHNRVSFTKSDKRWGKERFEGLLNHFNTKYSKTEKYSTFEGCNVVNENKYKVYTYEFSGKLGEQIKEFLNSTKKEIPIKLLRVNKEQAALFIDTWSRLAGYIDTSSKTPRVKLQCDNRNIADSIQHIVFLSGKGSSITERVIGETTIEVIPYDNKVKTATEKTKVDYEGVVWCPTVDDGVVVFRKDGRIFISGNSQSSFSNVTLEFGKPSDEIKDEFIIVGGDMMMEKYSQIPHKYFNVVNKSFIDVMAKGSGNGIPFTFPLITVPITDEFNHDDKMYLYLLDKMYHWGGIYLENFTTKPFEDVYYKSKNPLITARDPETTRSLCPLRGNEEVLYYNDKSKKYVTTPIKTIYSNNKKTTLRFLQNGVEVEGKINKFTRDVFAKITLTNGLTLTTSLDHLNMTFRGNEIPTSDLTTKDFLPVSRKGLKGKGLTREEGIIVGAFLGSGSVLKHKNGIQLKLHKEENRGIIEQLEHIVTNTLGGYISKEYSDTKYVKVLIHSKHILGLVQDFSKGDIASTRCINSRAYGMSVSFREGIIEGYSQVSSGIPYIIYTLSRKMVKSLVTLLATLGSSVYTTTYTEASKEVYVIRCYPYINLGDDYRVDNSFMWFRIKSIEIEESKENAYCVEVTDGSEPYFMMSNGILTHNCRLQIDLSLLSKVGGGIFGSSTGNTGAVQVLNLNLNKVLLEYALEMEYDFGTLKERLSTILEVMEENHQRKRKWILNNKNLYPTFFAYNKNLKNYFNVFAVSAMHEGLINIGYEEGLKDEEGKKFAHKVMQHIHSVINKFIVRDMVACGVEFAPNENAGVKLARHDLDYGRQFGKEIFVQGDIKTKEVYTTSGCMLPFSEEDFLDQVENAAEFQAYGTSGSILHQFLEAKIEPKLLAKHIQNLFKKPIIYTTLSPTLTSCMECGQQLVATDGVDIEECPVCQSDDIASFSRVIGYTKMISRKGIKVKDGKYEGEDNFWSNSRRRDWAIRKRVNHDTLGELEK